MSTFKAKVATQAETIPGEATKIMSIGNLAIRVVRTEHRPLYSEKDGVSIGTQVDIALADMAREGAQIDSIEVAVNQDFWRGVCIDAAKNNDGSGPQF